MSLSNQKVVLITGASGQVGSALVKRLASHTPLGLLDRSSEPPAGLAKNAQVMSLGVDLIDETAVHHAVERLHRQLGPIRALVHTVGGYADGVDVRDQSLDTVRQMFELNFISAVNVVKAALPHILSNEHGRIVLFSSADALRARAGASAYAASKAALLRFAEALAEEVAGHGTCVRVIVPTTIDTPRNRATSPNAAFANWVTLDEVVDNVEFLLSPRSSGMRFAIVPLGR